MAEGRYVKNLLIVVGAALAIWALAAFGLGILLPFLLGYLVARGAEPLVKQMSRRSRLPRWVCTGICVTVLLALVGMGLFLLGRVLVTEILSFVRQLPQQLASLEQPLEQLRQWLLQLIARAPDGLEAALRQWVERLFESSSIVAEKLYEAAFSTASNVLAALPDVLLFTITAVLASFMISAQLPALRRQVVRYLPRRWQQQVSACAERIKQAMGGWIRAQLTLMGVTFGILCIGLTLLGVGFPILFAGLIALIDALPVFGTGTVLIPWAVLSFVQQETPMAVGLLVLYGVAALTRTSLEPRFIGRQIGLNPLITLLAMYTGFRLCGILGMILFPVGAILLRQFLELLDKTGASKKGQRETG